MLVLFETAAGFAVYKLLDEKKLLKSENLYEDFETAEKAKKVVKLKMFEKFKDTTDALSSAAALIEGKMSKGLKKLLKKVSASSDAHEKLAVADAKLGNAIKKKLSIDCVYDSNVMELMRCIRSQAAGLLKLEDAEKEMSVMSLGLAHSLSRYKLKFSPDKIDTMIVQAVSLLDDLDKELNNYIMRCKEWYGWHFPEMGKIVTDNIAYVRTVQKMGMRSKAATTDLSDILPEDIEHQVKEAAEISMGTEVSESDLMNIRHLCSQIVEIQEYREQLYSYLKNRMVAIAPNLTVLVGELVGARLISHAGSLINLAKHPASTVQILGAEKALFKALKTKHDTPKYGLIYHAQIVGQSRTALKGKVSRMLAAKAALASRVDALGEDNAASSNEAGAAANGSSSAEMGMEHRLKIEARIRQLEGGVKFQVSGTGKKAAKFGKYEQKTHVEEYKAAADNTSTAAATPSSSSGLKRKAEDESKEEEEEEVEVKEEGSPDKKKKKKKQVDTEEDGQGDEGSSKKKSKKKKKGQDEEAEVKVEEVKQEEEEEAASPKKKKKKSKAE